MTHQHPLSHGVRVRSILGEWDADDDGVKRETGPDAIGVVVGVMDLRNSPEGWAYHVVFPASEVWVVIDQGDSIDDPDLYEVLPADDDSRRFAQENRIA